MSYSIFHSLKSEKQVKIINAAMKQFVLSGYDKASTNEIVKEAQISKGSLFNYFYNKKELYVYLLEHALKIIDIIFAEVDVNERDLFKRISQIGLIKLKIQQKYPLVFDFLKSARLEQSLEVKNDVEQRLGNILDNALDRVYDNIDYSKFRDDIDPEKALHILNWTMLGFAEVQLKKIETFENVGLELMNEWDSYKDILRRSFYKEVEQ
ncbi:TetR/AcrR family transcriptional regulator [Robertmurraya sp. DFI.2.37]|uniref:TetR/AcrR family transcriptional regulator n=1 Tax=Robertmurraya sp. DFI.2.37 TaxID=3031819 RepID=UPI000BA58AC5|nr:TetR/AcrR family transcriptional regulator [Robertmurraya sp. DFI.2.37]MDF1507953.1 TetR/AcrR family transcriptional regulator [Robertmurraya sp. DFI.2.37]PAE21120.1 TetR family transcriptional regulator [Bacillus sp. 7504-2]